MENKINEMLETKRNIEELQEIYEKQKQDVIAEMNGAEEMKVGNYKVCNKIIISSRFDSARFKKEHEEEYKAYQKESIGTRFEIKVA